MRVRAFDGATDWGAILKLYDALLAARPGPLVQLNRALALARVNGPAAARTELESLPVDRLSSARPFHAAQAEIFAQLGELDSSRNALDKALDLDPPQAERLLLERKRRELPG